MKKVLVVIATIIVSISLIIALIICIPQHIKIAQTLNAIQLDKDGNIIGTEEIAMQGVFRDYRFNGDTLELSISPFGTLKSVTLANDNSENTHTIPVAFDKFYSFTFTAWDTSKDDSAFGSITVSQDFEYWTFCVNCNNELVYYVASSSNEHTVEEIVQYFRGIAPGYVSDTETNWEMNGMFVRADGAVEEMNISVTGNIYTAENENVKLDIEIQGAEFPYLFSKPDAGYSSSNQKNNDLPHLVICPTYAYNKQTNQSTRTFFTLSMEEEYFIVLFADMPDCYYVAATDENVTHEQLLEYFADYIDAYSEDIWN